MKLSGFNAEEHEAMREGFEPIPAGRYLALIEASEEKLTKPKPGKAQGMMLALTFQIVEGQFKGRKLFANLNLKNESSEAVRIANIELAAICKAVNILHPNDSAELHDIPLAISVKQEKRADNGELTNRIVGYYPRSEITPKKEAARQEPVTAGNVHVGNAPWAR